MGPPPADLERYMAATAAIREARIQFVREMAELDGIMTGLWREEVTRDEGYHED